MADSISPHFAGSYIKWDVEQSEKPIEEPITTYGPYPCRAIPKLHVGELNGKQLVAFSGGLPRSAGSDKYTVTVIHDEEHVVFDFTSKVRKFTPKDTPKSVLCPQFYTEPKFFWQFGFNLDF